MKRLALVFILCVICVLAAARDIILVNYVFSGEGQQLMDAVTNYVENSGWTRLVNQEKPGDICLFIKEYYLPEGVDPDLRSFTVTFTLVAKPFGDYAEFVPIDAQVSGTWYVGTESMLLNARQMPSGLAEAISMIDTRLYLFLATYNNVTFDESSQPWEARIEDKLHELASEVVQWCKTPAAEGGPDFTAVEESKARLARLLGFISESSDIEDRELEVSFSLGKFSAGLIELKACPLEDSYVEGPLITAMINPRTAKIEIVRNMAYD